jgi:2-polyprenyl-6-methoxyphenol hydroxylase-like FAD-dependent oxidoreductase
MSQVVKPCCSMSCVELLLLQVNHKRVRCAHKCAGWSQEEGADYITCRFKGKPDIKAHMIIGADGVRSAVRASMFPDDPGPRFLVRHAPAHSAPVLTRRTRCQHHHCSAVCATNVVRLSSRRVHSMWFTVCCTACWMDAAAVHMQRVVRECIQLMLPQAVSVAHCRQCVLCRAS